MAVALRLVLGGLRHRANWTFLVRGGYHGLGLLLHRAGGRWRPRLPEPFAIGVSFLFVVIGWVPFRSATMADTGSVYLAMLGFNGVDPEWLAGRGAALLGLVAALVVSFTIDTYDFEPALLRRVAVAYGVLLVVGVSRMSGPSPFLYFHF